MAVFLVFAVLIGPLLSSYDPMKLDFGLALQPPSWEHWFGTDNFGRDILARVLIGGRIDLQVTMICVFLPMVLGVVIGVISGYFGGFIDAAFMRLADVMFAFPFYILVIAIVGTLGPSLTNLYVTFVLVTWISFAKIVRGETLVVRELEYIQAARAIGFSHVRIIFRHVLPNVVAPAIVFAMADVVLTILAITSLSFLGLGVQPPEAEWGLMISGGREYLRQSWWMATFPGFAIVYTGITFSLLGEGMEKALQPKR